MLSHSESLGPRAARASMAGEDSVQPLHGFIDEDIAVGLMVSPISVGEAAWACLHSLRLSRPLMVALRGEKGKEAAEKLLQVVCTSLLLPSPPGFSITSSSKAPFEFLYEGDSPGGSMRLGADEASSPYTFTHPLRWFWAVQVDGAISRQFEKVTYKCFFAQSQASKAASHSLSSSLEELEEGQARLLCPSLPANVGAKRTLINMCNTGGLAESGVCRVWGSYGQTLASSEEWKESDEQLRGALAPLLRLLTDFKLCDYRGQVLLVPVECFGGSAGRIEDVLRYTPSSSDEQVKRWQSLYRALLSQRVARAKDGALFPRSSFHPLLGRSGMSSVCEVAEARIRAVVDTFGIALAEMRAMPLADREGGVSVLDLVEKVGNEVPFPPFTSAENKTSLVITYASSSLRHLMGKQVSGRSEAAYRAVESGQTTAVEGVVEEAAAEESERGAEMGARLELEKRKIVCIPLVSGDSPAYGRSASAQRGSGVRLRTFGCLLVCADEEWSEAERQAVESVASLVGTWLALVEQMSLMEALHLISQSGRALHVPAAVSDAITASVSADAYFGSSLETKSIDHDKRWQSRSADAVWARATTKDAANLDLQCAFSPGVSSELQSVKRSVEEKEEELVNTMKGWEGVGESDVQSPIQSAFSYLSAASEEIKLSWDKAMVEVDLPGANKQAEVLMVVSEAKHLLLVKHRLERWLILFGPRWVKDGGKPDGKVDEVSLNIIAGALMLLGGMSMDEDMKVWKAIKVALSIGSGSAAKELLWARLPLFDPTSTDTVKNEKKFNTLRSMMNVCRLKAGSSPLLLTERILYCWLCVCDQIRRCAVHTMSLHSSLSGAERKGGFGVAVDDAIASMVDMRVRYAAEAISVAADTAGRPESVTLQPAVENSFKKPFTASQVLDRAKRPLADKVTLQYAGIDCLPSCPLQVAVDRRTLTSLHRFGVSGASEGLLPIVYPLRSGRPLFLGVAAHAVGGEERAGEGEKRLYFNATFDAAVVARAGRMQSRMLTTVGEKGVGSASRRSVQPSPSDLSSGGGSFLNDMREAGVARREGVAMWLDESLAAMLHLTSDAVLEGEEGEREGVDTLFICGETGNVVLRAGWTRPVPVIHIELLRALVALSESVVERPVSAGMTEDMSTATPFELSVVEGQGQERRHSVTAVKFLSTLRTTLNEAVLLSARPRGGEGEEEEEGGAEAGQEEVGGNSKVKVEESSGKVEERREGKGKVESDESGGGVATAGSGGKEGGREEEKQREVAGMVGGDQAGEREEEGKKRSSLHADGKKPLSRDLSGQESGESGVGEVFDTSDIVRSESFEQLLSETEAHREEEERIKEEKRKSEMLEKAKSGRSIRGGTNARGSEEEGPGVSGEESEGREMELQHSQSAVERTAMLEAAKRDYGEVCAKYEKAKNEVVKLNDEITVEQARLKKVSAAVAAVADIVGEAAAQVKEARAEAARCKEEMASAETEVEELRWKRDELSRGVIESEAFISDADKRIAQLRLDIAKAGSEVKSAAEKEAEVGRRVHDLRHQQEERIEAERVAHYSADAFTTSVEEGVAQALAAVVQAVGEAVGEEVSVMPQRRRRVSFVDEALPEDHPLKRAPHAEEESKEGTNGGGEKEGKEEVKKAERKKGKKRPAQSVKSKEKTGGDNGRQAEERHENKGRLSPVQQVQRLKRKSKPTKLKAREAKVETAPMARPSKISSYTSRLCLHVVGGGESLPPLRRPGEAGPPEPQMVSIRSRHGVVKTLAANRVVRSSAMLLEEVADIVWRFIEGEEACVCLVSPVQSWVIEVLHHGRDALLHHIGDTILSNLKEGETLSASSFTAKARMVRDIAAGSSPAETEGEAEGARVFDGDSWPIKSLADLLAATSSTEAVRGSAKKMHSTSPEGALLEHGESSYLREAEHGAFTFTIAGEGGDSRKLTVLDISDGMSEKDVDGRGLPPLASVQRGESGRARPHLHSTLHDEVHSGIRGSLDAALLELHQLLSSTLGTPKTSTALIDASTKFEQHGRGGSRRQRGHAIVDALKPSVEEGSLTLFIALTPAEARDARAGYFLRVVEKLWDTMERKVTSTSSKERARQERTTAISTKVKHMADAVSVIQVDLKKGVLDKERDLLEDAVTQLKEIVRTSLHLRDEVQKQALGGNITHPHALTLSLDHIRSSAQSLLDTARKLKLRELSPWSGFRSKMQRAPSPIARTHAPPTLAALLRESKGRPASVEPSAVQPVAAPPIRPASTQPILSLGGGHDAAPFQYPPRHSSKKAIPRPEGTPPVRRSQAVRGSPSPVPFVPHSFPPI